MSNWKDGQEFEMKKLVTFDLAKLRSLGLCYDPSKYLPKSWNGTVVDILEHADIPSQDKLWAVCHEDFLSARLLRRFAIAQAKTCRKHVNNKVEFDRILRVCRRYADGDATNDELAAAESAAEEAANSATYWAAYWATYWAAYWAADSAAHRAAHLAAHMAAESKAYSKAYSEAISKACRMLLRMIRADLGMRP